MNHERMKSGWRSSLTIILILVLGILIGKGWERIGYAGEPYEELKVFAEVLAQVKQHYVEERKTQDLVRSAIRGMLAGLDPHSSYMTPDMYKEMQVETKGEFGGLGIQIGMKNSHLTVIAPIEDTPAFAAGIQAGDIITEVDGSPTKDLTLMEAVQHMRGAKGTSVTLTVQREGANGPLKFTLVRDTIKIKSVRKKILDDHIGYVRISQFQEATADDLSDALSTLEEKHIQGLLLDLRNNPGGLLTAAVGVSEQFLEPGKLIVSIKGRTGGQDEFRARSTEGIHTFPMIILVNQGSASASEIVAAAMKDWGKAVILGTTTFGKGSVQTILPLSDGSGLRLTTAKYYTPKGKSIHKIGIHPDIVVKLKPVMVSKAEGTNKSEPATVASSSSPHASAGSPGAKALTTPETEQKDEVATVPPEDLQLQKAVELLKTWKVFKQLKPL